MTRRSTHATLRSLHTVGLLALLLAAMPGAGHAQGACGALTGTQVASILGPGSTAKELTGGSGCNWSDATAARKLQIIRGPAMAEARANLDEMWNKPGKAAMGTVQREEGLGDRAVSLTLAYGVNFMVRKGTRMFMLNYANRGVSPTAREHDALRTLAAGLVRQM